VTIVKFVSERKVRERIIAYFLSLKMARSSWTKKATAAQLGRAKSDINLGAITPAAVH
jgi:hypothetical protein